MPIKECNDFNCEWRIRYFSLLKSHDKTKKKIKEMERIISRMERTIGWMEKRIK